MISFRYHLVSIVAVFAALAVGIVAGSTVVKQSLVDSTKQNLERTERQLAEVGDTNDQLTALVDQYESFGTEAGQRLIAGHLTGTPIVLVETPELGADVRNGVLSAIEVAGGDVVARVRLDRSIGADDATTRMATALDSVAAPDELRQEFGAAIASGLRGLAERIDASLVGQEAAAAAATSTTEAATTTTVLEPATAAPAETVVDTTAPVESTPPSTEPPETTTTTADVAPDDALRSPLLDALDRANLVRIEDVGDAFVPSAPLAVVVLADRATGVATVDVLESVLAELAGSVPAVVAEDVEFAADDDSTSPSLTAAVRDDGDLRQSVSTVDDADRFPGWIATILTVEDRLHGRVGHYGRHDGSRGLFPPTP